MNKAFVKEDTEPIEDDLDLEISPLAAGSKNYMTQAGFSRLQAELKALIEVERVSVVNVVSWAAGNGDRSENGDYIYGKKRLREIDKRIRFLNKRLASAEVVDITMHQGSGKIFFGATVTIMDTQEQEKTYRIVGMDEADVAAGDISWISPIARALLGKNLGDEVSVMLPGGMQSFDIVDVQYVEK